MAWIEIKTDDGVQVALYTESIIGGHPSILGEIIEDDVKEAIRLENENKE